jgi:hypothetical protein
MTDLGAGKTTRTTAWINVIGGAFIIVYTTVRIVWSNTGRAGRLTATILLILAVPMFMRGYRQLKRSKKT